MENLRQSVAQIHISFCQEYLNRAEQAFQHGDFDYAGKVLHALTVWVAAVAAEVETMEKVQANA